MLTVTGYRMQDHELEHELQRLSQNNKHKKLAKWLERWLRSWVLTALLENLVQFPTAKSGQLATTYNSRGPDPFFQPPQVTVHPGKTFIDTCTHAHKIHLWKRLLCVTDFFLSWSHLTAGEGEARDAPADPSPQLCKKLRLCDSDLTPFPKAKGQQGTFVMTLRYKGTDVKS